MSSTSNQQTYDSSDIRVLQGLEAVRKRPAMYIGSTDLEGLHHLYTEILDNAVDEAIAGYCDQIWVTVHKDGSLEIRDNGRGIPVDLHPQTKVSTLETVMTNLHAGGKFEKGAYKVSGGLHGVGMKCTNALSEWMESTVFKDGKTYRQRYERGKPVTKLEELGKTQLKGTQHVFKADAQIFPDTTFSFKRILEKARQHAYLTGGLRFNLKDERVQEGESPKTYELYFEEGIKSYVKFMNLNEKSICDIFYAKKEEDDVIVEVAVQYTDSLEETVKCYTNNIINPEGGTHLAGFRTALTTAINQYATSEEMLKGLKNTTLGGDDVREGLSAVISVKVPDPQFEGQTKIKLNNPEVKSIVQKVVKDELTTYFNENPKEAKAIISKAVLAFKARAAAKAAREAVIRKGVLEGSGLPGKLADCSSKDPSNSELYIVEGDSAGGCFSGYTKVALADGRELSFKELIIEQREGKKNYAYTIDSEGKIAIGDIKNVRRTKTDADIVKVTLDNGEEIICTPDHKFMLRDGTYREAKDLTVKDSLMPLYKKLSKIKGRVTIEGYEMILNPKNSKWIFTHLLADEYNKRVGKYKQIENSHKHHIDFNKLNNNPENIIQLTKDEHLELHRNHIGKTLHRKDVIEKLRIKKLTPEFRKKVSERMKEPTTRKLLSRNAKKQWENQEYKEYMKEKYLAYYYTHEEFRESNIKRLNEEQKKYWSNPKNREAQAERVRSYYSQNTEIKKSMSAMAKKQWEDRELKEWRALETSKQWTPEFRAKRKASYDKTYLQKALSTLKTIVESEGEISQTSYNEMRINTNDKSLLRYETILSRFFNGDNNKLVDAVLHYNHKIKSVEKLNERIDVYDLEVPETHNFALASGVFVHNSAKQGRNRANQAILPLRGKIINSHKYRIDRILSNQEFKDIVTALGVGIGDTMNIENIRYHKVIIMADADVDGSHIATLVLTLIYRFFRPLIEAGYVYLAQPPLFKVEIGKNRYYFISEKEKDSFVKQAETAGKKTVTNRFKGLGEMNPDQLWETTMNPETRVLKRVGINDAEEADKTFEMLMGVEVPPRRRFIQRYSKVANLDV